MDAMMDYVLQGTNLTLFQILEMLMMIILSQICHLMQQYCCSKIPVVINRLYFPKTLGSNAIRVENRNSIGVIIGRVKREDSEDEACMSRLLDFTENKDCCHVTYLASMNSNKSFKSSMEGFIVVIEIISES